ncbi:glycosyltransferase [Candidatus Woesearchaeota archaeon]|nr:glycosyltransferase [Candidatus Woesearchaeota archaeon]
MVKLSLCLIVKNEEVFLEECLLSVQGLVDEIVIVDTGSTDKTKEIAVKFTSKVYDFEWCDDFAAARNESLKYVTGDWILVLDADEVIAKEDFGRIRNLIEKDKFKGYYVCQRNYTNNNTITEFVYANSAEMRKKIKGFLGWSDCWIVRLFAKDEKIKFLGEVHEVVDKNLSENGYEIGFSNIIINHYGELKNIYSNSSNSNNNLLEKLYFYKKLAEKKVKNNPNTARVHDELAIIYRKLGNSADAEKEWDKCLKINDNYVPALLEKASLTKKRGNFQEALEYYNKIVNLRSDLPEAFLGLGICYVNLNDLARAQYCFNLAIKLNSNYFEAWVNLGVVCERLNQLEEAKVVLMKALDIYKDSERAYYNLGVVYEKEFDLGRAVDFYKKALELGYKDKELEERVIKIEEILND